jgi:hypothetical protein
MNESLRKERMTDRSGAEEQGGIQLDGKKKRERPRLLSRDSFLARLALIVCVPRSHKVGYERKGKKGPYHIILRNTTQGKKRKG